MNLYDDNTHVFHICHNLRDFGIEVCMTLTLTFLKWLRSNVNVPIESPCVTYHVTVIVTVKFSLSVTSYEICFTLTLGIGQMHIYIYICIYI